MLLAVSFALAAPAPVKLAGLAAVAEKLAGVVEERQTCGSDYNGPNAGVNCGCFDSVSHSCDCSVLTAGSCETMGDTYSWTQDCNSCYQTEPDTCGSDGQGVNCGCYFLRSPDAVAGDHSCACHLVTKQECEDVAGPFQGIWTSGCNSCFEEQPEADACGGDMCGCYFLSAPDAVADDHSCRCDIKSQTECEETLPTAIWTSGCASCYE